MTDSLRIRWGIWNASAVALAVATCTLAVLVVATGVSAVGLGARAANGDASPASPALTKLAAQHPAKRVEAIVQLDAGKGPDAGRAIVAKLGGRTTGELHVINALVARMTAVGAAKLAHEQGIRAVSLNAAVRQNGMRLRSVAGLVDSSLLATTYPLSVHAPQGWARATGKGVGVAVIDTGVDGTLSDFRVSPNSKASRVVATAATNPDADNDDDEYGHGTHVAGIIAGNGNNRPLTDPLRGRYVGVAPEANLISIKASDEQGDATVLDVIYGLQFAVDFKSAYNIRVVNLSLESTDPQSYRTDPLDAAAEAAWFKGIVVVAAAGNRGTGGDAVDYAPGNDPHVISVGAVDNRDSANTVSDRIADWSSRGTTQDGYAKPEILAPGTRIVSTLAPGSAFKDLCPSCIVSGQYIRAGGTSMSAPMVTGAVADLLQAHPGLTPDQVKGALVATARKVQHSSVGELAVDALAQSTVPIKLVNQGLTPNDLIDPATGEIDYNRSRWSRSSWSRSSWSRSSWSRSSWSCLCSRTASGSIDPTRSSWSRSSWSMSWTK